MGIAVEEDGMIRLTRGIRSIGASRAAHLCFGAVVISAMVAVALPASASDPGTPAPAVVTPDPYNFSGPDAAVAVGSDLYIANSTGNTVTEVKVGNGRFLASIGGAPFNFSGPTAITAVGNSIFVTNGTGDSVTEFTAGTNAFVQQISGVHDPIAMTVSSNVLYVLSSDAAVPADDAVTAVNPSTGQLIGVASGLQFAFDGPTAIAAVGANLFVTNGASNSITEINAQTLAFVATVSGTNYQFDDPAGIAVQQSHLWITNEGASSVTEVSAINRKLIQVVVSGNLPTPGPIAHGDSYIFTASPPGGSPMISQIVPTTGVVTWMMCNTNAPYKFNNPQALVVADNRLWVVNEGGNSLTEMNADTGALIGKVIS